MVCVKRGSARRGPVGVMLWLVKCADSRRIRICLIGTSTRWCRSRVRPQRMAGCPSGLFDVTPGLHLAWCSLISANARCTGGWGFDTNVVFPGVPPRVRGGGSHRLGDARVGIPHGLPDLRGAGPVGPAAAAGTWLGTTVVPLGRDPPGRRGA